LTHPRRRRGGGQGPDRRQIQLRRSDHAAFWEAGFPALFITDTGEFRNDHYHCLGGPDEVADLDVDFAVGVTRATVEAAAVALRM